MSKQRWELYTGLEFWRRRRRRAYGIFHSEIEPELVEKGGTQDWRLAYIAFFVVSLITKLHTDQQEEMYN